MREDTYLFDILVLWSSPFTPIDSLWLRKEFVYECLFIFNCFFTHSYLVWLQALFFLLYLIELVNLCAICEGYLFHGCWVDMLSTMSHRYQRLCWCSLLILVLVSPDAWPCHSHNFGWANSYVLIFSYRSTICLLQVLCFISYLCSIAHFLCFKWFWGSEDAMFVHLVFKCNHSNRCINLGELSYFI